MCARETGVDVRSNWMCARWPLGWTLLAVVVLQHMESTESWRLFPSSSLYRPPSPKTRQSRVLPVINKRNSSPIVSIYNARRVYIAAEASGLSRCTGMFGRCEAEHTRLSNQECKSGWSQLTTLFEHKISPNLPFFFLVNFLPFARPPFLKCTAFVSIFSGCFPFAFSERSEDFECMCAWWEWWKWKGAMRLVQNRIFGYTKTRMKCFCFEDLRFRAAIDVGAEILDEEKGKIRWDLVFK